jgi:peroxiredoxin
MYSRMKKTSRLISYGLLLAISLLLQPAFAKEGERPGIPDIQYPDLSGTPQNLQQWRGKVLLLNFWASWCSPCLAEIDHLIEYQDKFAAQGLQVVGLGIDEPRKLKNVQRSLQINYPVLAADQRESRSLLKAWGNTTGMIPYTLIFDKQGKIVRAQRGIIDEQIFDTLVKPLLTDRTE